MKNLITLFIILFSIPLFAQDNSTVYIGVNGKLNPDKNVQFKKEIQHKGNNQVKVTTFALLNEKWQKCLTESFKEIEPMRYSIQSKTPDTKSFGEISFEQDSNGLFRFTETKNGKLFRKGYTQSMIPLNLQGQVEEYYLNGNLKSESVYKNNELISNKNWNKDGSKYIDNIFYSADKQPEYIPGNESITQNILKSYENYQIDFFKITGKLVIGFVILKDGTTTGFRIEEGVHPGLDTLTMKCLENLEGNWTPAQLNDEKVNYYKFFPVNLEVDESYTYQRGPIRY